jgi:ATP-dependent Clp protease adapter protein ClpS
MSLPPADQPNVPHLPHRPQPLPPLPPSSWELPRYHLILLPDAINDLMSIVRSIMQLTRFPVAEASHRMWEAQRKGRSVVFTTYRERAELAVELFAEKGLHVTLELA